MRRARRAVEGAARRISARLTASPRREAAVVFGLAWLALELGHGPPPLHGDSHEDLLWARACLEEGECPTAGARTTWPGVRQGALWVNLLALLRGAGVSIGAVHALTLAAAAAGVALVFAIVRRRDRRVAWIGAALATSAWLAGETLTPLWNPSLMPLPMALVFAWCLRCVDARPWAGPLGLGLALGLALEGHPVAALLLPVAAVVAGLGPRARTQTAAATLAPLALALGMHWAISPAAASGNLATALAAAGPLGAALGVGAVVAAALGLGPWARRLTPEARWALVAGLLLTPALLGVAYRALEGGPLGPRYLGGAVFPAAHLVANALVRGVGVRAAAGVAAVALALSAPRPATKISLPAVERLDAALAEEGHTLDELLARISGPGCRDLVAAVAAAGMPRSEGPPRVPPEDLVVAAAPDPRLVGRPRPLGGLTITEMRPWVRRRRFTACVRLPDAERCVARSLDEGLARWMGQGALMWARLSEPSLHWTDEALAHAPAATVTYRFEVRAPAGAGSREIVLPRPVHGCRPRFAALSGVRGSVAPERLVLHATDRPQRGEVVVAVDEASCGGGALVLFPPCVTERSTAAPE